MSSDLAAIVERATPDPDGYYHYDGLADAIDDIEVLLGLLREAREQALAEAEAAFRRIGTIGDKDDPEELVAFPAVLAALASLRKPVQPKGQE